MGNITNWIIILGFLSAFHPFYRIFIEKAKFTLLDLIFIAAGLAIMILAIIEKNKETKTSVEYQKKIIQADSTTRKKILDSLSGTNAYTNVNIDSTRKAVIDSITTTNDRTVSTLQKTIREQAHELDSLINLRGEKQLTNAEKIDILNKIQKLTKNEKPSNVPILISTVQNANYGKFPSQLSDFLESKGYIVNSSGSIMSNRSIKGYAINIEMSDGNPLIAIEIGSF